MDALLVGLALPFLGTSLGAACVLFIREKIPQLLQKALTGFAAGVMVAASVWSLLIPSMEMTGKDGFMSVLPDVIGFALDDKLDSTRVGRIMEAVSGGESFGQIFITDTNREHLDETIASIRSESRLFEVKEGEFKTVDR